MKRAWAWILAGLAMANGIWAKPLMLPEPPQQKTPWTAPPELRATNALSAAEHLFQLGFPDPRGCEYREIEVWVNGVGGIYNLKPLSTHGWILPSQAGETNRFAICWNGVIYPVFKLGKAASLVADIAAFPIQTNRLHIYDEGIGEYRSIYWTNTHKATRALLVLHCPEGKAYETNWASDEVMATNYIWLSPRKRFVGERIFDPYLIMAEEWAWALFDRMLCAHMRGDTALALATAYQLKRIQPKIEAEAARRGFAPYAFDSTESRRTGLYLDFLGQLPEICADLERRMQESGRKPVHDFSAITEVELIYDLQNVQAGQMGQPGWVDTIFDPRVPALVQIGDKAVPELLGCLEHDRRLTRSVGFGRTFHRGRTVIPVTDAARRALQGTLQLEAKTPAEFRAYWEKYGQVSMEERWFKTLQDDQAGFGQWMQAAANIVRPAGRPRIMGPSLSDKPGLRGEQLRMHQNPSLTELLTRRTRATVEEAIRVGQELKPDQDIGEPAIGCGYEMIRVLAAWENPSVIVAPARKLMEHTVRLVSNPKIRLRSYEMGVTVYIALLTQLRTRGGDGSALMDYAKWLKTFPREKIADYRIREVFLPLVENVTNQAGIKASEWLFEEPAPPWTQPPWRLENFPRHYDSKLMDVPAFRKLVADRCEVQETVGIMKWSVSGLVSYELKDGMNGNQGGFSWSIPDGTSVELRQCDWLAWELFLAKYIPVFNPFAPVAERDEIIAEAKAKLLAPP